MRTLQEDLLIAVDKIKRADDVTLVSHIDADGITSEAVLAIALSRAGVPFRQVFVRQLEPNTIDTVPQDDSLKIFTDLGSGQQNLLQGRNLHEDDVLILDHHISQPVEGATYHEVNSNLYGTWRLSAAGIAYFVARELDPANVDLAKLAVVGNVGDMMARTDLMLTGPAREIVEDGVKYGNIKVVKSDLNCFGISTRPIHLCLTYNDDPFVPGISGNVGAALSFLRHLGITLQDENGRWLTWEDLEPDTKKRIISALSQQLLLHGRSAHRLLMENYIFPDEPERPLRNASEFATMLNACGRWGKGMLGCRLCQGDRESAYHEAERMLTHHRGMIREMIQYILESGVTELDHLQYIHVGDRFPDTIVGIGAGMALSRLNREKPMLVMSEVMDDATLTKASMRTNEDMVQRGIDLQRAIVEVSAEIEGAGGGGHKVAAGAFIPKGSENDFVERINKRFGLQIR